MFAEKTFSRRDFLKGTLFLGSSLLVGSLADTKVLAQGKKVAEDLLFPQGVYVADGDIYVTDTANYQIKVYAKDGSIKKIGSAGKGAGKFNYPVGVGVGKSGNLYVLEANNHRLQVLDKEGGFIRFIGGVGEDEGLFYTPSAFCLDDEENIYVADTRNHRVQKFNSKGEIILYFGEIADLDKEKNNPYSLRLPMGVAVHPKTKEIYVANSNRHQIKVFSQDKVPELKRVLGKAGKGEGEFTFPTALVFDNKGNLFIADTLNNRLQVMTSEGRFVVYAQKFSYPCGLALTEESLYVADKKDGVVWKVDLKDILR